MKLRKSIIKMNNKKNLVLIIIIALVIGLINKSYAIYKLEEKYNIIENKIDEYKRGDVEISVLIDGKEATSFPSYKTNYKVKSIECTNGVVASWDIKNWRLSIEEMNSLSSKCLINFDSSSTNTTKPINKEKNDLIAINDELATTASIEVIKKVYPVGSVYITTSEDTPAKVEKKFGGTWVRYATDTTLVGYKENSGKDVNSTGGSKTIKLETYHLPSFSITGKTDSTGNGYKIEYATDTRTTSTNGNHSHTNPLGKPDDSNFSGAANQMVNADSGTHTGNYSYPTTTTGNHSHTVSDVYVKSITGIESHSHGITAELTNDNQQEINIENPYTIVYMYKRTK